MSVFFPLTFLFFLFLIPSFFADNYNNNYQINTNSNISSTNVVDNITASNPFPSPSPSLRQITPNSFPFKPTIAVILGVITTFFSITFLFLVYSKHCRRNGNPFTYSYTHASSLAAVSARRNSGINRTVVESLPLFRFSSLRGQKDGLECAVCLTRFEPSELLRLLPKCKHAFHVECVDTWLDAHSTCPLCRYRVDPEDILLIEEDYASRQSQDQATAVSSSCFESAESESSRTRRVSGRHSYAGERATSSGKATTWFRRSLDSSGGGGGGGAVGVGGLGYRKDGLLLVMEEDEKKRLEHRIIVSGLVGGGSGLESGFHQRWSDVQPSDLLYLRSEMIISQSRRSGKTEAEAGAEAKNDNIINGSNGIGNGKGENGSEPESSSVGIDGIGRSVINSRSVSEITGLSRFSSKVSTSNDNDNNSNTRHDRRRPEGQAAAAGLVSRWLAWISSTSHSEVRSQPVETIAG